MSLRREVHSAFDVIAPPLAGMPERVVQTVLAEHKARGRKRTMLLRLRAPLSLVAVFLLIALIGLVLIGGRLVQDWNAVHKTTPAGPRLSLQELEARPLHIPIPAAPNDCVSGPFVLDGYGSGPIHLNTGPVASTAWGVYSYLLLYADSKVQGPVLVRVVHLFYSDPVVFVGPNSAGPVLQKDTLDGKAVDQHKELFIDTSVTTPNIGNEWATGHEHQFLWPFILGEPTNSIGAKGWQIDGPDFIETFLTC